MKFLMFRGYFTFKGKMFSIPGRDRPENSYLWCIPYNKLEKSQPITVIYGVFSIMNLKNHSRWTFSRASEYYYNGSVEYIFFYTLCLKGLLVAICYYKTRFFFVHTMSKEIRKSMRFNGTKAKATIRSFYSPVFTPSDFFLLPKIKYPH